MFILRDLCAYFAALWLEKEGFLLLQIKSVNQYQKHMSLITINS